ncbi:MAG TPA: DNA-binding protein [Opitutae bacterium]|nr:DNA-binding protein [Opitutae bacterium]
MVLVDSNILIDVFTDDPVWGDWSFNQLVEQARRDTLGINSIIYAEISIAFSTIIKLEAALAPLNLIRSELPYQAGFLAGKAFLQYKHTAGVGQKQSPLPDFYIGAHAATAKFSLMTRDINRYRTYFPEVNLICPR